MRYYIMKEKRGSLDMSETECAIISLGMIVFIVIVMAIYLSVVGAAIIITINCGALFRNHGRKFALCFVPVYNLYLCSKILTGKGLVLLGIIATLCVDAVSVFGLLNGNLNFAGVGKVLWTIVTILLVIFHFYLVGYFNCQISRLSGVNEQGDRRRRFLDVCPVISWIVFAVFLVKDMGKC